MISDLKSGKNRFKICPSFPHWHLSLNHWPRLLIWKWYRLNNFQYNMDCPLPLNLLIYTILKTISLKNIILYLSLLIHKAMFFNIAMLLQYRSIHNGRYLLWISPIEQNSKWNMKYVLVFASVTPLLHTCTSPVGNLHVMAYKISRVWTVMYVLQLIMQLPSN